MDCLKFKMYVFFLKDNIVCFFYKYMFLYYVCKDFKFILNCFCFNCVMKICNYFCWRNILFIDLGVIVMFELLVLFFNYIYEVMMILKR